MKFSLIAITCAFLASPSSIVAFAPSPSTLTSTTTSTSTSTSLFGGFGSIDIQERAPRNLEPFDQWANNCGVQRFEGFQFTSDDGLDISVATSTNVPAGEVILAVPENMIITASKAKQELMSLSQGGVSEAIEQMSRIGAGISTPQFYLFLKILLEYQRDQESPYYPWLDSMPRLYYNAVSMTDFCYECLPPLAFSLSRTYRLKFDNIMLVMDKVDIIDDYIKNNIDICKWAFNVVITRCIGEEGEDHALIPVADMFNHGTETEVDLQFDGQGNCLAVTTKDVPAGSPLRISYGCPTNPSKLFARYGFLDETSPATFCKMMDIQSTPELVDLGFDDSKMVFYKDTGDIAQEVWDVVLYSKVLKNQPDVQRQFHDAHVRGDGNTKQAIHQQYSLETVGIIKDHVDTFIKSLDDLHDKTIGKDVDQHPRLPLIVNHNTFVRNTFMMVKQNVDQMYQSMSMQMA